MKSTYGESPTEAREIPVANAILSSNASSDHHHHHSNAVVANYSSRQQHHHHDEQQREIAEAIHVNAQVVEEDGSGGQHPVVYANVVQATPVAVDDGEDTSKRHVTMGVSVAMPLCFMSFVLFILGCVTMNYLGHGAGAWYAALFVFLASLLFLMGGKMRTCNTRNMVISSLVVSILAIILSFIGMLADFVWMGFAKHVTACDKTELVIAEHGPDLIVHGLQDRAADCAKECFAFAPTTDDRDATSLCYDHNWGTCNDFCDGEFQHLAAACGSIGLFSFMGVIILSVCACCGLCVARRR